MGLILLLTGSDSPIQPYVGFGGGYNKVSVDVTEESAPEFFFDYEYDGFLVYGTAIF